MKLSGAIERLERAVGVCGDPDATPSDLRSALRATTELQSFLTARRGELVTALEAQPAAFPEATIAETSGCSLGQATRETERARTLDAAAAVADALSDGQITAGHVDALTRAGNRLGDGKRSLLDQDVELARAAASKTIAEYDAWLKKKAAALDTTDPEDRLERQRRDTRLSHWVDKSDGMWRLRGQFDPQTGVELARLIDGATDRMKAGETPTTAPSNALEREQHLAALGFADLVRGGGSSGHGRPGAPIVVIDATQTAGPGDVDAGAPIASPNAQPVLDWGYPVELPLTVLASLAGTTDPEVIVVSNGVVLHAPGRLDLGRATRLANRAQRRALAGLYATCAIPGCTVHYDRCRLHHVVWWRHGGRTDLDNLLPVCQHHHTRLHADQWNVTLGPNRELTITIGDGQVLRSGPPRRSAA